MSTRDLREKYGSNGGTPAVINRAIRAECPGGNEALDALRSFHEILRSDRLESNPTAKAMAEAARNRLVEIANAMEAEIRRRYGMPPETRKP
ncbi:hypothetical protein [Trichococcus shcherbakoviae]|uniref:hypothetical protein n=1 Tax=Trichococcus shcherbakoviae TaxID=2094020 RepID=UPI002AA90B15|nr:hypothetical protein [Trichococcus shcherbakoviae]